MLAFLKTLDARKIDNASEHEITFPLGQEMQGRMKGADYLCHSVLPNFYFHRPYDILRHDGVELQIQK